MRRLAVVTVLDQMGYSVNADKTAKGEEFEQQMDSFGQAHLAGFLKQQNQMIMQQMAQMSQQMTMVASKPPPQMQQMQYQPQ